jgi:hypothetical protein
MTEESSFYETWVAPACVMLVYGGMIFLVAYYVGLEIFSP